MSKIEETKNFHLHKQAELAVKLFNLNLEVKKCEEELSVTTAIVGTFKFIEDNPTIPEKPEPVDVPA